MKREIRDEWVKRLRSGDYEQGSNYLSINGTFCCLGVLCEIAAEEGVIEKRSGGHEATSYGGSSQFVPPAIGAWADVALTPLGRRATSTEYTILVNIPDGPLPYDTTPIGLLRGNVNLMELNDGKVPFSVIADVIENGIEATS